MGKVLFSSWNGSVLNGCSNCEDGLTDTEAMKLPHTFDGKDIKGIIGWKGLIVFDDQFNLIDSLRAYFEAVQGESCGICIPCRVGTKVLLELLVRLTEGKGTAADIDQLENLGRLVRDTSLCGLGRSAPVPLLDSLKYFRHQYLELVNDRRCKPSDGDRYTFFPVAPCVHGCPAHIDVLNYVGCVGAGKFEKALELIREKTPLAGVLGRVCVHPCEDNCRRRNLEDPVAIRALKRFVADFERGLRRRPRYTSGAKQGKRVAVIGAGPAGLNAAYQLARMGYNLTVFEALPVAGGMLAVGIPSYRLPREILTAEINIVQSLGVQFRFNTRVGVDIPFAAIEQEFDAVFISTGLHENAVLGCEGEDPEVKGFLPGVKYLRDLNLGAAVDLGDRVAVIGGGNVAIDCARSALRLGVKEVNLIYRRSRAEMPANASEIRDAGEEGIVFHFLTNPKRLVVEQGRVVALECIRMKLGEPDASGRRRPIPIEGSEFTIPVDTVIPAIGQVGDFQFLVGSGVEVTRRGTIKVDSPTLATNKPGVFAGGDAVLGARTVIEAVATGNKAAESIDRYLREGKLDNAGEDLQALIDALGVYDCREKIDAVASFNRHKETMLDVPERLKGFAEVELGLQHQEAVKEAERCLQCRRLGLVIT